MRAILVSRPKDYSSVLNASGLTPVARVRALLPRMCAAIVGALLLCALMPALMSAPMAAQEAAQRASAAAQPLITQPVDESQLTRLTGNTHPLARPEFDLGTAPTSLPMSRMLLVLKRSPDQETTLRKLLDDQQDKASPNYHKWLTPTQYGQQFGPTDSDLQTITAWLQQHCLRHRARLRGRQDVHDTVGNARLGQQLSYGERGQRGLLGQLERHGTERAARTGPIFAGRHRSQGSSHGVIR